MPHLWKLLPLCPVSSPSCAHLCSEKNSRLHAPVLTFGSLLTHSSRTSSRHFADTEDCSCAAHSCTLWSWAAHREPWRVLPLAVSPSPWLESSFPLDTKILRLRLSTSTKSSSSFHYQLGRAKKHEMASLYKQGIHNFTTAAVNQTLGRSCICSRDRQQTQKQKEALHTTKGGPHFRRGGLSHPCYRSHQEIFWTRDLISKLWEVENWV